MEVDTVVDVCRRSLDETLQAVHKLTTDSQSAADTLLHGMNNVLREVVDTNFASGDASLAQLFRMLERAHAALIGECDNLPLLFFARSFAVVLDEAVRRLQHLQGSQDMATVPHEGLPYSGGALAAAWSSEMQREEQELLQPMQQLQLQPPTSGRDVASQCGDSGRSEWSSEESMVTAATTAAAAATTDAARLEVSQQGSDLTVRKSSLKRKDYSAEATKGRITIYRIPRDVRLNDVREFLRPIGKIRSLHFPTHQHTNTSLGYALAKFKSNQIADAAVARLHDTRLGGERVVVRRAAYWATYPDAVRAERSDHAERSESFFGGSKEASEQEVVDWDGEKKKEKKTDVRDYMGGPAPHFGCYKGWDDVEEEGEKW